MAATDPPTVRVSVAYGAVAGVCIREVELPAGSSVEEAIVASGILKIFPEIDLRRNLVGIFNKACAPGDAVCDGDRVEIYRPLLADPKEARRRRAAQS